MNERFEKCLERRQIVKDDRAKRFAARELAKAEADLATGQGSLARGDVSWATVQFYYSCFHSARAMLYNQGYREHSHQCLIHAMQALFVETGRLDARLLRHFERVKVMREKAD